MPSTKLRQNLQQQTFGFTYPFAAIVGMPLTKRALLLLAVDPLLKSVVIAAASGSAKSVLGRSIAELFPRTGNARPPFVEVPVNVTDEKLFGGLDIEYALSTGSRRVERGLVSRADSGILYVDNISLLEPRLTNQLLTVIDQGRYQIEREGISAAVKADFVVVGSFGLGENELHRGLLERIGLIVSEPNGLTPDERTELLRRQDQFARDPGSFVQRFHEETIRARKLVQKARKRLSTVAIVDEDRKRLSEAALRFGITGSRAEIFAVRAARANAALSGRDAVTDEDLALAVQITLVPKALTEPKSGAQQDSREPEANSNDDRPPQRDQTNSTAQSTEQLSPSAIEDLVIDARNSEIPPDLDELLRSKKNNYGRPGTRLASSARHQIIVRTTSEKRGKHIRSTSSPKSKTSIDLFSTLVEAAPHQRSRPEPGNNRVRIEKSDLRFKQFKQKDGSLFIFVVDASGSMALNRMNQAKGALVSLLQRSYLNRDKVALIAFRKNGAEILLPPSQSVALAKRAVDSMPVGGATPLAAGLVAALEMVRRARQSGVAHTPVVVFTDGRANVGLTGSQENVRDQIEQIATEIRRRGIPTVVIDTHLKFTSSGEGERLANLLGGRYSYLPRADVKSLVNLIRGDDRI